MKILVFGASGATGNNLVSQGVGKGYRITAFVRDSSKLKIKDKNLSVFMGDVSNAQQVADAIRDQDAVISALGAATPFKRDFTLIKGIENIVGAMTKFNVRRFVYQSYLGVKEHRRDVGFLTDRVISVILKNPIKDHEVKEKIITSSTLQWTIVRCSMLTNGTYTGSYVHGERIDSASPLPSISRADVAAFMLEQLHDTKYINKKPRIMSR
jgi:putative NADH-flavin reductase